MKKSNLTRNSKATDEGAGPEEELYSEWHEVWKRFCKHKAGVFSLGLIIFITLLALLADIIAPYEPYFYDYYNILQPPSAEHIFGTDFFGRDVLTLLIHSSRISLIVGLGATGIAMMFGVFSGLLAGYYGGSVDNIIMRGIDILFAFPATFLAIAVMAYMGGSTTNAIFVIGIVTIPMFSRVIRSNVLSERAKDYVLAVKSIGVSNTKIMLRHVLPNCIGPLIVIATLSIATAILLEAGLSFLGLGSQPPSPTWGSMLSDGRQYIRTLPLLCILPGIMIMITVLGFNLAGDALRDAMDPQLRFEKKG